MKTTKPQGNSGSNEKHVSQLVIEKCAIPQVLPWPKNTTLAEVEERIDATAPLLEKHRARGKAHCWLTVRFVIEMGAYFREGRVIIMRNKHERGDYGKWLNKKCQQLGITKRSVSNWTRAHDWYVRNGFDALKMVENLRQLYLLAGILPDPDDIGRAPKSSDNFARLRRLISRVCRETASHRSVGELQDLTDVLIPLANLLSDVSEDIRRKLDKDPDRTGWISFPIYRAPLPGVSEYD